MSGKASGVGVFGKRTEAQAEGLMLSVVQRLATEINHLMAEQRMREFLKLRIADLGRLCAAHFRPHRGGQGPYFNVPVTSRVIIELAGGMKPHG